MTKILMSALLSVAFTGATTSAASAATPIVSAGILTGARGVTIGSKIYDVAFQDGTCEQVYGSCTTDLFDFTSYFDAQAAALALLDQVFIDSAWGLFDSKPALTFGCSDDDACSSIIPYGLYEFEPSLRSYSTLNYSTENSDYPTMFANSLTRDTSEYSTLNFARFTSVTDTDGAISVVPEPATWAMMLLGFGMIGAAARYRRGGVKVLYA